MKQTISIILGLGFLLALCACGQGINGQASSKDQLTWQEQYDLGVRYLEDGDYEEAIIAFTAAIEIDPKRAEAYIRWQKYTWSRATTTKRWISWSRVYQTCTVKMHTC